MNMGPGHTSPDYGELPPAPQSEPTSTPSAERLRSAAPEPHMVIVETPPPAENPQPSRLRTNPIGLWIHRRAAYAVIRANQAQTAFGGVSRPDIDPKTGEQRMDKYGRPALIVEAPTQNRLQIWWRATRRQRQLRAQLRCGDISRAEYTNKSFQVRAEQVSTPYKTGSMRRTARTAKLLHRLQLPAGPPEETPPVTNPPKKHWLEVLTEKFAEIARNREALNTLKANYDEALMAVPKSVEQGPYAEIDKQRAASETLKTLLEAQYQIDHQAYEEFIVSDHGKRLVELLNRLNSEEFAQFLLGRNSTIENLMSAIKVAQEKSLERRNSAQQLPEEVARLWQRVTEVRRILRDNKDDPAAIQKARQERDRLVPYMRAQREKLNKVLYEIYSKHAETRPGDPVNIYDVTLNNIRGHWTIRPDGSAILWDGNGQKPVGEFKPNGVCHYLYATMEKKTPEQPANQPEAQPAKPAENEKPKPAPKPPVYRQNAGEQSKLEHLELDLANRMHVLGEVSDYLLENRNDPNKLAEVRRHQYIFELLVNSRDELLDLINRMRNEQKIAPEE